MTGLFSCVCPLCSGSSRRTLLGRSNPEVRPFQRFWDKMTRPQLGRVLVTPLMGYFIADYYLGDESFLYLPQPDILLTRPDAKKLTGPDDMLSIRDGTTIYVQVNYFQRFAAQYLPVFNASIILMTGQWNWPAMTLNDTVQQVLSSPKICHWFTQNPFTVHPKLSQIPIGVNPGEILAYAQVLGEFNMANKTIPLLLTPLNAQTDPSRQRLADAYKGLNSSGLHFAKAGDKALDFYRALAASFTVMSPRGDRPDCNRHWEAIGLGARPISNVPQHLWQGLLKRSMLFTDSEDFEHILSLTPKAQRNLYVRPERRLILIEHWRQVIDLRRAQCINVKAGQ